MVDAADLKSFPPKKITEKLNNINWLTLLTFAIYTYTCVTHFRGCYTHQIHGFDRKFFANFVYRNV
jgi:hypothetical protein